MIYRNRFSFKYLAEFGRVQLYSNWLCTFGTIAECCNISQLHEIEERNGELWDHIEDLRTDNTVLYEENSLQKHENNILKGDLCVFMSYEA